MPHLEKYPREALLYFLAELGMLNAHDSYASKTDLLKKMRDESGLPAAIDELLRKIPVFADAKFIDCWNAAFPDDGTVCFKTSFGACAYDAKGKLIAWANNKRIGAALSMVSPFCNECVGCVRRDVISRTDQTIGECNHAIVWLLARIFELGIKPSGLSKIQVYEVGFLTSDGFKPWWRKVNNYTCLYCARIFLTFNLRTVYGTIGEKENAAWHPLSIEENYVELAQQALREMKTW